MLYGIPDLLLNRLWRENATIPIIAVNKNPIIRLTDYRYSALLGLMLMFCVIFRLIRRLAFGNSPFSRESHARLNIQMKIDNDIWSRKLISHEFQLLAPSNIFGTISLITNLSSLMNDIGAYVPIKHHIHPRRKTSLKKRPRFEAIARIESGSNIRIKTDKVSMPTVERFSDEPSVEVGLVLRKIH